MVSSKLALILAVASAVMAAPASVDKLENISAPTWDLEISPGRVESFTGTIQEAVAQAIALEPSFQQKFEEELAAIDAADAAAAAAEDKRSLTKRSRTVCSPNYIGDAGLAYRIEEGVKYLRTVSGKPRMGSGCNRLSCSWGSAILLCSSVSTVRNIPTTWNGIADSAQHVTNVCKYVENPGSLLPRWVVRAENFEDNSWSTIVKGDNC